MATNAAFNVYTPGTGSGGTVAAATADSTYTSVVGITRLWLKSTVDTQIRFGASAATTSVTTADIYLSAGVDYVFDLRSSMAAGGGDAGFKIQKLASASTGTLYWRSVG
jgi:hypothetical protein